MNKWLELILGLILVIIPVSVAIIWSATWGAATVAFLQGAVIVIVALVGLLFIMLGISDLKD